ncbi:MAG: hypothetical protein IPK71_04600 [Myxococcales bacterium]|nr:hypothetical protein [Myxococcales bacterium]
MRSPRPLLLRLFVRLLSIPVIVGVLFLVREMRRCDSRPRAAPQLSPEDLAKVTRTILDDDEARRAALAGAKSNVTPRPELGNCPIGVHTLAGQDDPALAPSPGHYDVPRLGTTDGGRRAETADDRIALEDLGIAYADEVATKPGPWPRRTTTPDTAKAYLDPSARGADYALVIDDETPAKISGPTSFVPGRLRGHFYVWDRRSREIVCAADVDVVGSTKLRKIEASTSLESTLASDVREQAIRQARERLVRAR